MEQTESAAFSGRIGIVGAGAVGAYYGARLAQAGNDVHFLLRSDAEAVERGGYRVTSCDGDFHLFPVQGHRDPAEMGPCDLVVVALKTTAQAALETLLPPLLHPGTVLLTLQNGLGADEWLAARHGAHRVIGGLCFVCINRLGPGLIDHQAQGHISLGEFTGPPRPRTTALAAMFRAARVSCGVVESLARERWKKLVWNIPFNGLSIAAGGVHTAEILATPALEARVRRLMREAIGAAAALGHSLPADLEEKQIAATRIMGPYRPSSLIDFQAGREVELETIWGEPLRRAQSAGCPMPELAVLYSEIADAIAARRPEQ